MQTIVQRKFKAKEELTPEERELLRRLRRERRQRGKETKRREKEEVKRLQMTGAKDLKISLISRDVLQKFYGRKKFYYFRIRHVRLKLKVPYLGTGTIFWMTR